MALLRKYNTIIAYLKFKKQTNKQNNSSAYVKGRVNANANVCQSAP